MVRQDDLAAKLVIERELGCAICDPFIGLIVEKDGKKVGVVIFNDYTPGQNIEMTVFSLGPWSIADVRTIAKYCFDRVRRITARTKNERAAKMLEVLGFKREGILREWFEDGDAILYGLLKSEQRIYR